MNVLLISITVISTLELLALTPLEHLHAHVMLDTVETELLALVRISFYIYFYIKLIVISL